MVLNVTLDKDYYIWIGENLAHLQWGDNQKILYTYKGETTRKSRTLTMGRQPENLAHLQRGDNQKISHTYKGETTRKSRTLTKVRQQEILAHLQ